MKEKTVKYLKRIADELVELRLSAFGAVHIKGPKWCGKTTTALQHAKSVIQMQDPNRRMGYLATARAQPTLLLKGAIPRLIDEWQDAPMLWDAVRMEVDARQAKGQFILTGSTVIDDSSKVPEEERRMHTGVGRISSLVMYPMSLYESLESSGEVSLASLFDAPNAPFEGALSSLSMEQLIFSACRGGWPASLDASSDKAKLWIAKEYLQVVCESDVSRVLEGRRNASLARLILRSYGRNVCTLVQKTKMLADVAVEMEKTSMTTFDEYVDAFERLYVLKDLPAWCPAIRSATSIRASKKRNFMDPSLAVAALGASPSSLEQDLRSFGFIFECLCIRDLQIYSQALGGYVSYYRDRYGLEADIVLHLEDGRFALIECKLGASEIDMGAKHLVEIKNLIHEHNATEHQVPLREPDLLIVLTGGEFAYKRQEDGVYVIPIGCLKP